MLGANPLPGIPQDEFNITNATTEDPILSTTTETTITQLVEQNETRLGINRTKMEEEFVCAFYNPDFIIYSSLGSFYIPCVIMVFLYIRIFSVRMNYV